MYISVHASVYDTVLYNILLKCTFKNKTFPIIMLMGNMTTLLVDLDAVAFTV